MSLKTFYNKNLLDSFLEECKIKNYYLNSIKKIETEEGEVLYQVIYDIKENTNENTIENTSKNALVLEQYNQVNKQIDLKEKQPFEFKKRKLDVPEIFVIDEDKNIIINIKSNIENASIYYSLNNDKLDYKYTLPLVLEKNKNYKLFAICKKRGFESSDLFTKDLF